MKELEYIKARQLGLVTAAIGCLGPIVPANNDCIDEAEFIEVIRTLQKWFDAMYESMEIEVES